MRKVGQSPHESDPLVPKSRDYARSDQISTLSEVIIEFYVEIRVYKSPNTILQRNVERFSRIIRSTQGHRFPAPSVKWERIGVVGRVMRD